MAKVFKKKDKSQVVKPNLADISLLFYDQVDQPSGVQKIDKVGITPSTDKSKRETTSVKSDLADIIPFDTYQADQSSGHGKIDKVESARSTDKSKRETTLVKSNLADIIPLDTYQADQSSGHGKIDKMESARSTDKSKRETTLVKSNLADIIPLDTYQADQSSGHGKIDKMESARSTDKSKREIGEGKKKIRTESNPETILDRNDFCLLSEKNRSSDPSLIAKIASILKQAGITDRSNLRSIARKIEQLIIREIRNVVINGGISKSNNKPKIELPALAPELYAERLDKKENPVNFLDRVWGKYLEAGVLYQCDLRGKNGRDPKLMHAIVSYCTVRKLNISSYIPSKKDKTEKEVLNLSLDNFLGEPDRFSRAAMAFYQRQKRRKK